MPMTMGGMPLPYNSNPITSGTMGTMNAGNMPAMILPGNNLRAYQSPVEIAQGDTILMMKASDGRGMPMPLQQPMVAPGGMGMPPPMLGQPDPMMGGGFPDIELPQPDPMTTMSPRELVGMQQGGMMPGMMPPMMGRQRYMGGV